MKTKIRLGKYQHYRGNFYVVLGTARHSETLEEFIVYRALYNSKKFGRHALWIRPAKMFLEKVDVDGKKIPRYRFVGGKW